MKTVCSIVSVLMVVLTAIRSDCQTGQEEIRLRVTNEFAAALRQQVLSNEEIMRKFVAGKSYYHLDSVRWRAAADEYINNLRTSARALGEANLTIFKYAGHEDAFAIMTSSSIEETPVLQRLTFALDLADHTSREVDTEDLYVIANKNTKGKGVFILFDADNRIISFSHMKFGNHVGLWQW